MAKILVVEDDRELSLTIENWLITQHHTVECIDNGREAAESVRFYKFDLIVLDWELPELSGPEICRGIRASGSTVPVLMLTGKGSIGDKEHGFDAGADDYLTKPFHMKELSMRIGALLRRSAGRPIAELEVGSITLCPKTHKVKKDGAEVHLHPKEFALLEFLMRHPGQVFSPDALVDHVWSSYSDASPESIRAYITKLRAKIALDGEPSIIRTVHGVGYKVEAV